LQQPLLIGSREKKKKINGRTLKKEGEGDDANQ